MSLDTVAQQLKLAPRQVTALEEDDFAKLPGRTFVRGFMRNYARLVRIDAEKVLAALPGGDAPALDSPALQPTAPTIGHLPTMEHAKPGWTRWAIPLTLVGGHRSGGDLRILARPRRRAARAGNGAWRDRARARQPAEADRRRQRITAAQPDRHGTGPATEPGARESAGAAAGAAPGAPLAREHHYRPDLAPAT